MQTHALHFCVSPMFGLCSLDVSAGSPFCIDGYVALPNGPGCASTGDAKKEECLFVAKALGYSAETLQSGDWGHAPVGCFVGHNDNGWAWTYFNEATAGTHGSERYRSICLRQ